MLLIVNAYPVTPKSLHNITPNVFDSKTDTCRGPSAYNLWPRQKKCTFVVLRFMLQVDDALNQGNNSDLQRLHSFSTETKLHPQASFREVCIFENGLKYQGKLKALQ